MYIKALGDWTKALHNEFKSRHDDESIPALRIQIRGPYGAPAQHVDGYSRVVLIAGGIGSTPFASVCKHMYAEMRARRSGKDCEGGIRGFDGIGPNADYGDGSVDVCDEYEFSARELTPKRSGFLTRVSRASYKVMRGAEHAYRASADLSAIVAADFCSVVTDETDGGGVGASEAFDSSSSDDDTATSTKRGSMQHSLKSTDVVGLSFKREGDCDLLNDIGNEDHDVNIDTNHGSGSNDFQPKALNSARRAAAIENAMETSVARKHDNTNPAQHAMRVLHSVVVNVALCGIMMARLMIIGFVHMTRSRGRDDTGVDMPVSTSWKVVFVLLDVLLGSVLTAAVASALIVELLVRGRAFFASVRRVSDLAVLLPLAVFSNVVSSYVLAGGAEGNFMTSFVVFAVVNGALGVLVVMRLFRLIGDRVMLADAHRGPGYSMLRAIDFIWTTPTDDDDEWLRDELEGLADGRELRLHRYITRVKEDDVEAGNMSYHGLMTNFGYVAEQYHISLMTSVC